MASMDEQETIINYLPTEKTVSIYTAYPPHIRKIQSDNRFKIIREFHDSDGNLEAIDATTQRTSHLNILTIAQRAPLDLSDEQRQARAERVKGIRRNS